MLDDSLCELAIYPAQHRKGEAITWMTIEYFACIHE